jgi:hypothetical protein
MLKRWLAGLVAGFAVIQVVSLDRTNPPVTADIRAAADVKSVLRRACYDCHSSETVWPWYSRVAPVSWLVQRDVRGGRAELNFSSWEALPKDERAKKKHEVAEDVAGGDMPPFYYTPMHPHAVLSSMDKQLLQAWARGAPVAGEHGEEDDKD